MYTPIRKADLVIGGTSIKQGEIFTLGFQLFDANGVLIIPTVGQSLTVKIAQKSGGVVYETTAVVVDDHIEFTVAQNIGNGKMNVELTVADGVNVLQKYPASGYIELHITASLDDIGTGFIYTVTAAEMFTRIENTEVASADAVQKAGNAVTIANAVRADFDLVIAEAGSSNPEVVLARGGEANLGARLDKTNSKLAEKAEQVELENIAHTNVSIFTGDDSTKLNAFLSAHAGKTVRIPRGTYNITSTVEFPANTEVEATGVKFLTTTHITVIKLNLGVEIKGLEIEGAGNSVYNANGIGISIKGTWNSTLRIITYVQDIKLTDCNVHHLGAYGIFADYAQNIKISGGQIEHVGYAGIGGLSVSNVHVFNKTLIKEVSPGTSGNAYGIFFSRKSTTTDLVELPQSSDCSVSNCAIEDVPLWEGLDTHGGQNINFMDNTITNCRVGIALVSIDDLVGNPVYAPKNCKAHGNTVKGIGTGVGIVAIGALTIVGSPIEYADRISIQGNNLTECGIKGNDAAGGIEFYGTRGISVVGNTLLDCYPHGISVYHTNEGFTIQGNTVIDPQDTTVTIVSAVIIRSTFNKGVISGNSFIKVKASTTDPILNVAKRGITLSSSVNNEIILGANYNNCEIKQIGTDGQAVTYGSLVSTTNIASFSGVGTPEGVIIAPMGSTYVNKSGGVGTTFYVKQTGSGNTGWAGK